MVSILPLHQNARSVAFCPAAATNLRDLGHRPGALESSVMLHFLTSFRAFAARLGVGDGTVHRLAHASAKNLSQTCP
jgi:hypothetical protein